MKNSEFRLWDKGNKVMHHKGFYIGHDGDVSFDPKVFKAGTYNPFDMELMKFTHHLDRTKKKIFEKDIVEFVQFNPMTSKDENFRAEVYYDYSNSALRIRTKSGLKGFFPLENAKIVGNMCQSPEKFV